MAKTVRKQKNADDTSNYDFVQVYKAGWDRMDQLVQSKSRSTLRLYIYILSHMNQNGIIYSTQAEIAKKLGLSISTIKRNLNYLIRETKSIVAVKTKSSVNMYGINPNEAWRTAGSEKTNSLYMKKRSSDQLPKTKKKNQRKVQIKADDIVQESRRTPENSESISDGSVMHNDLPGFSRITKIAEPF